MDDRTRIHPGTVEAGVGTRLSGIYELDERIASGGMGEVFRGHNIETGDLVAIKIVLPEFARDPTILSLFRKEASILNHLSHEAVVRYHVFTVDPAIGRPYLAMEYVDGQSLFDVMRQGPMAAGAVRRLCHRLASGLSAVHRAGAIHRDLSPDNVILPKGRVERAKIIDFGIARSAHAGGETLIGGRFAGKYNYVSPEQLGLYGGEVSERSDIYSLGLVLAAALRGSPLEMTGSQVDVVEKRRSVPDLAGIDEEMRPIIEAMLQPDPQERPASMAEIARICRQAADAEDNWDEEALAARPWTGLGRGKAESGIDGEDEQARFVEHVRPAHLSRPKPPPVKPPSQRTRRQGRLLRMRGIAIAGLAVALLAAAGGGAHFAGYLPWASAPDIGDRESPPLVPDRAAEQREVASVEPSQAPPATHQPAQARPEEHSPISPQLPSQAQSQAPSQAQSQALGQAPGQAQDIAPAADVKHATPQNGLAASEIIKRFLEQTKKNPADTGAGAAQSPKPAQEDATLPQSEGQVVSGPNGEDLDHAPAKPSVTAMATAANTDGANAGETSRPPSIPPEKAQAATAPEPGAAAQALASGAQNRQGAEPQTGRSDGETVAMNVPRPSVAPPPADTLEKKASWLHAFAGGDCFYAAPNDTAGEPFGIVGFATTSDPFVNLMKAFDAQFATEPDIQVRLISPAQCAVTRFMHSFGVPAGKTQTLTLDRTSVPDGSPISGILRTQGGLRSNLFLIDHDGMTYNLDRLLIVDGDMAKFNARIRLDSASRAKGRPMPEIVLAITGAVDIESASTLQAAPAAQVLPKIRDEIQRSGAAFSATAKYFQLGG